MYKGIPVIKGINLLKYRIYWSTKIAFNFVHGKCQFTYIYIYIYITQGKTMCV